MVAQDKLPQAQQLVNQALLALPNASPALLIAAYLELRGGNTEAASKLLKRRRAAPTGGRQGGGSSGGGRERTSRMRQENGGRVTLGRVAWLLQKDQTK